jgi:hypothetical protein
VEPSIFSWSSQEKKKTLDPPKRRKLLEPVSDGNLSLDPNQSTETTLEDAEVTCSPTLINATSNLCDEDMDDENIETISTPDRVHLLQVITKYMLDI